MTKTYILDKKNQEESENIPIKNTIKDTVKGSIKARRTYNEIRDSIIKFLDLYPCSTYHLAKKLRTRSEVALRHLQYLKSVGRVELVTKREGKRTLRYWRLK